MGGFYYSHFDHVMFVIKLTLSIDLIKNKIKINTEKPEEYFGPAGNRIATFLFYVIVLAINQVL
jgi:hypothetical protein